MKKKAISYVPNEDELNDFNRVKFILERKTNADTIRAMINFILKNFKNAVAITTTPPQDHPTGPQK